MTLSINNNNFRLTLTFQIPAFKIKLNNNAQMELQPKK